MAGSFNCRSLLIPAAAALLVVAAIGTYKWSARPLPSGTSFNARRAAIAPDIESLPGLVDARRVETLHANLDRFIGAVTAAYDSNDEALHGSRMLALLHYSRRIPVHYLASYQSRLIAHVKKHGSGPVLSFYLDYGSRLAKTRTKWGRHHYRELAASFRYDRTRNSSKRSAFIRNASSHGFRRYSENVGWAAAAIYFSSFGDAMTNSAATGADAYLRTVSLLDTCRKHDETNSAESAALALVKRPDVCELLRAAFDRRSPGGTGGGALDDARAAIADLSGSGFMAGVNECLTDLADDAGAEMVDRLEDYLSCRAEVGGRGDVPGADWFRNMVASGGDSFGAIHHPRTGEPIGAFWEMPTSEGGKLQVSHQEEGRVVENPDGTSDVYVGDGYRQTEHDSNGNVTSDHYEFSGTNAEGDTYTEQYDFTKNSDGSSSTSHNVSIENVGSVDYSSSTDANGNTTETVSVTIEYDDGSTETWTTTTTNGQTTTTHTTTPAPSTPVNDVIPDPCRSILHPDLRQGDLVSKIETQIIPGIDSATAPAALTQCLAGTNTSPQRCTSVWLCLDGKVDENCRCETGRPAAAPESINAGRCAQMTCLDGTCDPATGTCTSGGSTILDYGPGVSPLPGPEWNQAPLGAQVRFLNMRRTLAQKSVEARQQRR